MNCNFATTVTSDTNQFDICHLWESLFFIKHFIDYVITLNDNKCHFSSFLHPEYISPRLSAPRHVFGTEVCGLIRDRRAAEQSHRPRAFSVAINSKVKGKKSSQRHSLQSHLYDPIMIFFSTASVAFLCTVLTAEDSHSKAVTCMCFVVIVAYQPTRGCLSIHC